MKILLIGCGGSAGYNFVESIKMADPKIKIVGTDISKEHLELSNCDIKYLVPKNSAPEYIPIIKKIIATEKIDFVHIQPDPEVAFWSEHRFELNSRYFLPGQMAIKVCHDKMQCHNFLQSKGVPVPESKIINSKEGLKEGFNKMISRHGKLWVRAIRGAGSRASLPITKLQHAEMWIDYWNTMKGTKYGDFMLAEYLPGKEYAFQSIWYNGKLITSAARQRLEYVFGSLMPSGQSSSPSVALSVHNKLVNEIATKAIKTVAIEPHGIFCVDMKENKEGVPCVTEINIGRFFTTNDFFSKAGCNMPYYSVMLGMTQKIPKLKRYNAVPRGLYWLRIIDMGKKMVKEWSYKMI